MADVEDKLAAIFAEATAEQKAMNARVNGIATQNQKMLHELAENGVKADMAIPRVEKLIQFLMAEGILTLDQAMREREAWELGVRAELQAGIAQVRQMLSANGQDVKTTSGLVIPGKGGKVG